MLRRYSQLLAPVIVGLCGLGCSDDQARLLQGRWFGESLINVDADVVAPATAWARGTSFEFTGSNVTVTIPTELPRTGPYEVVKSEERDLTVAFRRPNGQVDLAMFTLLEPHLMRWYVGDERAIVLRRVE